MLPSSWVLLFLTDVIIDENREESDSLKATEFVR